MRGCLLYFVCEDDYLGFHIVQVFKNRDQYFRLENQTISVLNSGAEIFRFKNPAIHKKNWA